MQKTKYYYNVRFPFSVIKDGYQEFKSKIPKLNRDKPTTLEIRTKEEMWNYDTIEEFFAQYPKCNEFRFGHYGADHTFSISGSERQTMISIQMSSNKADIEAIFQIFESKLDQSTIAVKTDPVKIFIGHGRNLQWRDLKDHLHEQHGFDVEVYEIGSRAGLSVKEVLEKMMENSSIAFLVLTGEDIDKDDVLHARENVIHELGLFQGHLGFNRAIAVKEDGVKEFSNIIGLNQIRFSKGNIKETYGDILATIKREFSSD